MNIPHGYQRMQHMDIPIYNKGIVRADTDIGSLGDIIIPEGIYRCNVFNLIVGICEISMRQKQSVVVNAFSLCRDLLFTHPLLFCATTAG